MSIFQIKKGRDLKIKGAADKNIEELSLPKQVAVQPQDFRGLRPRLRVKVGDTVEVGSPVMEDKDRQQIVVHAPASGTVTAINRGDKRALLQIVIEPDGRQTAVAFPTHMPVDLAGLSKDVIIKQLLQGGCWPCIRQRPFSKIAHPEDAPKAIFIHAMNTEPLALDVDVVLKDAEADFQAGIDVLKNLTQGDVHLCCHTKASSPALTQAKHVVAHGFAGPHPAGNVSTHIHYVNPINKGDVVWYVEAQDVVRIGRLFVKGVFDPQKFVAVTGEGASKRNYKKTIIGAPVAHLTKGDSLSGMRCISGSVLRGTSVGAEGFMCFYDEQLTVIPEGGVREFIGWLMPGFNKHTFSKTYASAFVPKNEYSMDTDKNGGDRAIVLNHLYDEYVPLDIMTYFLLKAVLGNDIEEAEKLGILECDEEDFALCTFACPSKTDVGGIIRDGLELIEKEG